MKEGKTEDKEPTEKATTVFQKSIDRVRNQACIS